MMNKLFITIFILATLLMTACEIPEMCFHGNKIGWDAENESHFSLKVWDCNNDVPIVTIENISSNITNVIDMIENITTPIVPMEIIPILDLTGVQNE